MNVILLNAGLPMIVPSMMVMIVAVIPIILLEAFCFHSSLGVTFWNALKSSAIANIFSTVIGIPVTWAFLILLRYLTDGGRPFNLKSQPLLIKFLLFIWESSWMFPRGNGRRWTIYVSGLVLIVPFFFASWFSEYWIVAYFLANVASSETNKAVRNANLLSYFLLAIYILALLVREQRRLWKAMSNKLLDVRREQRLTFNGSSET